MSKNLYFEDEVVKNSFNFQMLKKLFAYIIYVDDKNILESCNHEELMKKKGKYYELVVKHE